MEISLSWKLLPCVVLLLVREGPIDHSQTMATDMQLVGMGCCIGTTLLIEGLASLRARHGLCVIGNTQLKLLLGT